MSESFEQQKKELESLLDSKANEIKAMENDRQRLQQMLVWYEYLCSAKIYLVPFLHYRNNEWKVFLLHWNTATSLHFYIIEIIVCIARSVFFCKMLLFSLVQSERNLTIETLSRQVSSLTQQTEQRPTESPLINVMDTSPMVRGIFAIKSSNSRIYIYYVC